MNRPFVTKSIGAGVLVGLLIVPVQGCTNLDETPLSVISTGSFFSNEAEVRAGLAGVYAQLRSTAPEGAIYDANEVTTDEIVVPIRGGDWNDNGQWIDLHNQTWSPTSIATSNFFNGAWNSAYTGVARATLFISALQNVTVPNKATYLAEGRALRAFYYYILMDHFGGVPIDTTTDIDPGTRSTRRELFDFIESQLEEARTGLPDTWDAANDGRFTKGAVDAILASMYINAGVFTKDGAGPGGINAASYNSCLGVMVQGGVVDACQAAIDASDRILNSGFYQLADSFPQNFRFDNFNSPENIFVVKFIAADGVGIGITIAALHYCQYAPLTPWNGFSTLAATYQAFDATDVRRNVILMGPQFDVLNGAPATIRVAGACPAYTPANALIFEDTIPDIRVAQEFHGGRIYKWPADPAHVQQNSGNDFAWFRLGEIYLIKAEAQFEQGNAAALATLNLVRARPGQAVNTPLVAIDRPTILRERLFELFGESKRRQDLIRFGGYTGRTDAASGLAGGKEALAGHDHYVLFPVPQTQINSNPLLTQNPGY
jgi:starch-binding outer membrane protein, SusD/RagB family